MANPYQSPTVVDLPSRSAITWRIVDVLAWSFPLLLLGAFYGTWLAAWGVLGHIPRPMLDDPGSISRGVSTLYVATGVLLVVFPVTAAAGLLMQLIDARRRWLTRWISFILLLIVWVAVIMLLRWDPLLVVQWYMD